MRKVFCVYVIPSLLHKFKPETNEKKTHFTLLDPRKNRSMMHPAAAIIEKSHTHPATEHVMRYDVFACVMAMAECVSGRCR